MKKILITGALGHIGSGFIHSLKKNEYKEVVLVDNFLTQKQVSLFNLNSKINFKFYNLDILDKNIEKLFKKTDYVIHLAAITDATNSFKKIKEIKKVNYVGSKLIIKYCEKYKCKLIFPSTTSVYGTQDEIVDEECTIDNLNPQSPYAEFKLKLENYLINKKFNNKFKFIILRLGTIFGTSVGMRFHTAVNKFCYQASMNEPLTVWKTALNQKRPYLGLNDAVRCIKYLIKYDLFDNSINNIVTSNNTVNEIISIIKKYKKNIKINLIKTQIMNQLSYEVLSNKIKNKGFKTQDLLTIEIKKTLNLFNSIQNF